MRLARLARRLLARLRLSLRASSRVRRLFTRRLRLSLRDVDAFARDARHRLGGGGAIRGVVRVSPKPRLGGFRVGASRRERAFSTIRGGFRVVALRPGCRRRGFQLARGVRDSLRDGVRGGRGGVFRRSRARLGGGDCASRLILSRRRARLGGFSRLSLRRGVRSRRVALRLRLLHDGLRFFSHGFARGARRLGELRAQSYGFSMCVSFGFGESRAESLRLGARGSLAVGGVLGRVGGGFVARLGAVRGAFEVAFEVFDTEGELAVRALQLAAPARGRLEV